VPNSTKTIEMIEFIQQPWTWYVAGILIGLTVPALLLIGNKQFGISSSLRHICTALLPSDKPYFNYDWKREIWSLFFAGGVILGGVIATTILANPQPIEIAAATQSDLSALGIQNFEGLAPAELFSFANLFTLKGFVFVILGGFLVGFGTRYAGGCTSGHSITGLSNFQLPSLVATICFMAGGFFVTWVVLPILMAL
jgi:uncharacterized protein